MPPFLKILWRGWMKFAHVVGKVNTIILLTVFYFVILAPFGIVLRIVRFFRRTPEKTFWITRGTDESTIESLQRPF